MASTIRVSQTPLTDRLPPKTMTSPATTAPAMRMPDLWTRVHAAARLAPVVALPRFSLPPRALAWVHNQRAARATWARIQRAQLDGPASQRASATTTQTRITHLRPSVRNLVMVVKAAVVTAGSTLLDAWSTKKLRPSVRAIRKPSVARPAPTATRRSAFRRSVATATAAAIRMRATIGIAHRRLVTTRNRLRALEICSPETRLTVRVLALSSLGFTPSKIVMPLASSWLIALSITGVMSTMTSFAFFTFGLLLPVSTATTAAWDRRLAVSHRLWK